MSNSATQKTNTRNRRWLSELRRAMSPAFCGAICLTVQDGVIQVMRVRDEVPVRRVEAPAERSSLNEFMESLMHNCLVKGFFGEATAKVVQSEVTRYSFERVMKEPSEE